MDLRVLAERSVSVGTVVDRERGLAMTARLDRVDRRSSPRPWVVPAAPCSDARERPAAGGLTTLER